MKTNSLILTLVALVISTTSANAQVEKLTANSCQTTFYEVVRGDILYTKHGTDWTRLLPINPGLTDRIRTGTGDRVIAMIYPGDKICIPEGMLSRDFVGRPDPDGDSAQYAVIVDLTEAQADSVRAATLAEVSQQNRAWLFPWILVTLFAFAVPFILWMLTRRESHIQQETIAHKSRTITVQDEKISKLHDEKAALETRILWEEELSKNPVVGDLAIVRGGLTPENLEESILAMAAREWQRMGNSTPLPMNLFTIKERVRGRAWGLIMVLRRTYGSKNLVRDDRRLNGQRVWQATVIFPGTSKKDKEKILYILEECGNDLIRDGVVGQVPADNFRFEADEEFGLSKEEIERQEELAELKGGAW